jgi:hypothetical protein
MWFGLLYPLVPTTTVSLAATLLLPIPIMGYIFIIGKVIYFLSGLPVTPARRCVAILLALSVGFAIFAALYVLQHELPGQFRYGF